MSTKRIEDFTSIGNIADGDKLLGQRVSGTNALITIGGVVYDTDFGTNGIMARVAAGAYSNRTITGTAGYITVTNGDGVSGNPTLTIDSTYAGQNTIATVGTVTTGTWQATPVSLTYGGTNANLTASDGGIFYSTATAGAILSGTATANKMLLSGSSAAPSWSTSTIPSSAGATANKVLLSDGTNYVLSTPTFPNASATSGKIIKSDGTNWIASTTTMPDTGTSGKILRGNGTNYVESTATFADTYTASNLLYSNGSNTVTGLATANNGVLVTNGSGVPSISTDIPTAVTIGGSAIYRADANNNLAVNNILAGYASTATAAGTTTLTVASAQTQVFTGSTTQTVTMPVVSTLALGTMFRVINLSSGVVTVQSSGANTIQAMQANSTLVLISNATSGTGASVWHVIDYTAAASGQTGSGSLVRATSPALVTPTLGAATATTVTFSPTTGGIVGTTTNDNADAGKVGEVISSTVSAVAITSATLTNVTSISLTAGDWDVWGTLLTNPAGATTQSAQIGSISTTSATLASFYSQTLNAYTAGTKAGFSVPLRRLSVSGTTTVYLVGYINYAVSTLTIDGELFARRRR